MSRAPRRRVRRNRGSKLPARNRWKCIEHLEDRVLLFSDPFFSAKSASIGVDLRLLIENDAGQNMLSLVDQSTGKSVASASLSDINAPVRIVGSNHDDLLSIELGTSFVDQTLPHGILFEAGQGQ